jgi:hypothetical protein
MIDGKLKIIFCIAFLIFIYFSIHITLGVILCHDEYANCPGQLEDNENAE